LLKRVQYYRIVDLIQLIASLYRKTAGEDMGESGTVRGRVRLASWLKRPLPRGGEYQQTKEIVRAFKLVTVCESARCPNLGECWSAGTATFMILGDQCTRRCTFCAVETGKGQAVEEDEPMRVAMAVKEMGLRHVVITSVARDDLKDDGAGHFARVIGAVREMNREMVIEVLTPDFKGQRWCLDMIRDARPDVFNHNVETVRRLTPEVRGRAKYDQSLGVLKYMSRGSRGGQVTRGVEPHPTLVNDMSRKQTGAVVKSGFMVGLGEGREEILELLGDLRESGVEMLTIGQYLCPSRDHRPVTRYYHPDEFGEIKEEAEEIGFEHVASGPYVRSSYHAEDSCASLRKRMA